MTRARESRVIATVIVFAAIISAILIIERTDPDKAEPVTRADWSIETQKLMQGRWEKVSGSGPDNIVYKSGFILDFADPTKIVGNYEFIDEGIILETYSVDERHQRMYQVQCGSDYSLQLRTFYGAVVGEYQRVWVRND